MIERYKKGNYLYLKINNIGYLEYQINYDILDITDFFIEEKERKKGYASLLLKELFKEPVSKIMLEVREDNINAINLYKKHGFNTIHIRKKYYKDKDALIMERCL